MFCLECSSILPMFSIAMFQVGNQINLFLVHLLFKAHFSICLGCQSIHSKQICNLGFYQLWKLGDVHEKWSTNTISDNKIGFVECGIRIISNLFAWQMAISHDNKSQPMSNEPSNKIPSQNIEIFRKWS